MRTKTLVLAAAALAAGLATSVAQSNVYSLNIVGYVNVGLTSGFQMVANQMDFDGTGTNNTVNTVFGTNLPTGSSVVAFSGGGFLPAALYSKAGWGGNTNGVNPALQPGGGVFVFAASAKTVTFVGNVMTGTTTNAYGSGFNVIGSEIPQAGKVTTDLSLVPPTGSTVVKFNPATQLYLPAYLYSKAGWGTNEPSVGVAESFWLSSSGAGNWVRTFTVGP
jgi:hypothetical protein